MKGKLQKALLFFSLLQIVSIVSIFYEIYYLNLNMAQIIVVRFFGLLTDILETYLFIFVKIDINKILVLRLKLHSIKRKDIFSGLKLALIGPNIYVFRIIFVNFIVIPFLLYFNFLEIDYIPTETILKAYVTTLVLSFIFGFIFFHIEASLFHIKNIFFRNRKNRWLATAIVIFSMAFVLLKFEIIF